METKKISIPCKFTLMIAAAMGLTGFFMLTAGIVTGVLIYTGLGVGLMVGAFIIGLLHGSLYAGDEGLVFEMPFRAKQVIPYDEIEWVDLDVKKGSRSRSSSFVALIYTMKIITASDTISIERSGGTTEAMSPMYDLQFKDRMLMDSPFNEFDRVIKEKKGLKYVSPMEKVLGSSVGKVGSAADMAMAMQMLEGIRNKKK